MNDPVFFAAGQIEGRHVMSRIVSILFFLFMLCTFSLNGPAIASEAVHLRMGLVKYGTASWEIATIRRHGFDRTGEIVFDITELANPAAGEVALQAGAVDAIVTDWLWVARQRHAGQPITFVPHNAILGDVLVPAASPIRQLGDLEGKRLGVAGGPYDKSWLLIRAFSRRLLGHDIVDHVHVVYGAPPLLLQELEAGHTDAVLTYWPFAARLTVRGYRTVISMSDVMTGLGLTNPVPMLGYGISEKWLGRNPAALRSFLSALSQADAVLAASDDEWQNLRSLTAAENDEVLISLRNRFRQGLVATWTPSQKAQAAKLFALLTETGGAELTGGADSIPAGTFYEGLDR